MFDCLNSIKVPSGYSSDIKRLLNLKEKKFACDKNKELIGAGTTYATTFTS